MRQTYYGEWEKIGVAWSCQRNYHHRRELREAAVVELVDQVAADTE